MAEQELMNHPLGAPETEVSGEECATGPVTMLYSYLEHAEECIEAVKKMPARKFNYQQCDYLADKLEVVVKTARSFLVVFPAEHDGSSEDMARHVEIFKLLVALAKQIESFIQGCCKDGWIQAAMTLTNVSEYVSSLGFNLELCRVALHTQECAANKILKLDQVANMYKAEVEVVKSKASGDCDSLVAKVLQSMTQKSLSTEENDLAGYLLLRLHRVKPVPHSAASGSFWGSIVGDEGSVLGNLYKWVKPLERLGKGATGTVYRALWLRTPVAKKTFSGSSNADFKKEVEILGGLCHPNVTSMFCCAEHTHSCSIIMELMDEDLYELMQKRCESRCDGNPECPPFTIFEAVDIMLQVGEGMNYLHTLKPSIVHRDLKSSNILVKCVNVSDWESGYVQAKVTDFGLSKTKDSSTRYSHQTWNVGTHQWMAPEVINFESGSLKSNLSGMLRYPHKCDVYSFAMVCYEILTGDIPFPNIFPSDVKKMVKKGQRPILPNHCPNKLKDLIHKCWHQDPTKRPSFDVISIELKYLKYLLMTGVSSKQDHLSSKEPLQEANDHTSFQDATDSEDMSMPEAFDFLDPIAHAPPVGVLAVAPSPKALVAPQAPKAAPLDLFPQGMPGVIGGSVELGALEFLQNNPQFRTLKTMVQINPRVLQPMLQELGIQNPTLLRLINDNQLEFLRLINEYDLEGDGGGKDATGQPQSLNVITPEEIESFKRLEAMEFHQALVIEAFLACNKNEQLAVKYLMAHGGN